MYLINRTKDNIIPIVKSLRPIKYLYSKQNKEYDKYFHGSCLKDFVKQINSKKKTDFILDPGENINEYNNNNKDSGIDFKNALNYFRELAKLKNLSFKKINKVIIKPKRYNSEENKTIIKKSSQSNKGKRKIINLVKIRKIADADITLDPGKYTPNYNYIKRRSPCAFFGKVKKDDDSLSRSKLAKSEEKDEEDGKKNSKNLNNENKEEKSVDNKNNKIDNKKINKNNKKLLISFSDKDTNPKEKKHDTKDKQIKLKLVKNNSNKNKENKRNLNKKLRYINSRKQATANSSFKDATVSSWYKTNEFDKNEKMKKSRTQLYGTQTIFRNNKIRLKDKLSSEDNVRCTVMFDKMQGREKPTNFSQGKREELGVSYSPNYNFIIPHIPATIFKSRKSYEDVKKYMTYKIIRSYRYNSENYFVFLYNEKKENQKNEKHE